MVVPMISPAGAATLRVAEEEDTLPQVSRMPLLLREAALVATPLLLPDNHRSLRGRLLQLLPEEGHPHHPAEQGEVDSRRR